MSFLAPLLGIVAAAIAIPILIGLYLLKLRRRTVKVSTTAFWESAVRDVQANVPLRWIRPSWLLVLQLVGLVCLLLALARPAVPTEAGPRGRTIIVIDHSAAMSARDGSGSMVPDTASDTLRPATRLDEAKRRALEVVEQLAAGGSSRPMATVIALAQEARIIQSFTSDPRRLREAIESIGPTDQPARLDEAVRLAAATASSQEAAAADGTSAGTSMLLFTDGGLEGSEAALPGSITVRVLRCGPNLATPATGAVDNLGIVAMSARRDAEKPGTVRVFVRVQSVRDVETDVTLTWTLDGEPSGLLPMRVPAASRGPDGAIMPGELGGTFLLERSAGGLVVVNLPREDVLHSDNTAAVMLNPANKPRVLVVGANDTGDALFKARGPSGVDRFLLGALNDLEPAELRVIDAGAYAQMFAIATDAGDAAGGQRTAWDLIVFDRVSPTRWPNVPTISIGAAMTLDGLSVTPIERESWADAATRIISWRRTHPILRYASLDSMLVSPPMRMTIADDVATGSMAAPRASVIALAFGKSGPLIALLEEPGPRRVRRLVIGFDLLRTNWGPEVSFPVFVSSAVDALTGRGEAASGVSFTTREPVALALPSSAQTVRISGPQSMELEVMHNGDEGGIASMGIPRLAGVYRVRAESQAGQIVRSIAVNLLDPRVSALGTRDVVEIAGRATGKAEGAAQQQAVREVWSWFVLAAGILLSIEWFVYAWRMRS
ncbi:MAG: VWA domain-containing protein [Phycisphaerales bacterium]|nr:VWA domain-containing protein [Phycisphaerales bacterium]